MFEIKNFNPFGLNSKLQDCMHYSRYEFVLTFFIALYVTYVDLFEEIFLFNLTEKSMVSSF